MHLFEITTTEDLSLPVFASSFDEAAVVFIAWWTIHRASALPDFEVKQRNPRWPGLNTEALADALRLDIPGVGLFVCEKWRILPAEHKEASL